ncbi:acetyltransferase [Flavivirga amylovorans]|uniref:Acetyltransferase n=1 Tax=Flavivirga amylovorans TaxID=870486 RepID=A0ABT8X1S4_9FLAO|nr:acetyltransferase [Flavivirga amylovorans]MDO5987902.1 acetyltransferase [Flavivirga amylovorans]
MKKIVIIGASGHAKVIIDIIEKRNEYQIIGLIDSYKEPSQKIMGYPILGKESLIPELMEKQNVIGGIMAIGDNWSRKKVRDVIKNLAPKFKFLPAIHPNAILCNNLKIEPGVVIMAGVIVNAASTIKEFCILNTNSSLGHDSVMHHFSSLAPSSAIGGHVSIGAFSAVSMGTTIIQNITIGIHTIIGAGSLVLKDIGNNIIAYGVPVKEIKKREIGEPYLAK